VSPLKSPGTLRNSKPSAKRTASKRGDCARATGRPACGLSHRAALDCFTVWEEETCNY